MVRSRGVTLIELLVVVAVLLTLSALALPAINSVRRATASVHCQSNLRQIGYALAQYQSVHRVYPFGVGSDGPREEPRYSLPGGRRYAIHSQLLPYLDAQALYDSINFDVPPFAGTDRPTYGSPYLPWPNRTAASATVAVFLCPSDKDRLARIPWGKNNYRACTGSGIGARRGDGMFGQNSATAPKSIIDGLSKTAAFAERVRGDDLRSAVERPSDLFNLSIDNSQVSSLTAECQVLSAQSATSKTQDVEGGKTWLEGNMNWTRYNHSAVAGGWACKQRITWLGTVMPPSSRHVGGSVNLLTADGAVAVWTPEVDIQVWQQLADLGGRE